MNRDPKRICILGIQITDRVKKVADVQNALTEFGCNIKTRLGLHDIDENFCSTRGIIIVEVIDTSGQFDALKAKLSQIEGIELKEMIFEK